MVILLLLIIILVLIFGAGAFSDAVGGCFTTIFGIFCLFMIWIIGKRTFTGISILIEKYGWAIFGLIILLILTIIYFVFKISFIISDKNKLNNQFIHAVNSNETQKALRLLKKRPNVNIRYNALNYTPLISASANENEELVRELIKYKAKLNLKNKLGKTAYAVAKDKGFYEIEKILIRAGAKKK